MLDVFPGHLRILLAHLRTWSGWVVMLNEGGWIGREPELREIVCVHLIAALGDKNSVALWTSTVASEWNWRGAGWGGQN